MYSHQGVCSLTHRNPLARVPLDSLRRQGVEQRLRLLQIARVEPLSEPAIDRTEQFAGLLHLALVAPEPRKTRSRAELPGLGLLLPGDLQALDERPSTSSGLPRPVVRRRFALTRSISEMAHRSPVTSEVARACSIESNAA